MRSGEGLGVKGAAALAERRVGMRDALAALNARQIAWLVFLATFVVYTSLVPWVSRRWWLTGDEPHYLVATHSLLTDRDLELSNNYLERDFTLFYVGDRIDPHVTIGPDGGSYPSHTVGLSVLLLPAYALGYLLLGSHAGVLYFLNLVAALLAANVYLLCYEVTGRKFSSLLAWVVTAFTPSVMQYAYQVYPEVIGALLLVWSLRHMRQGQKTTPYLWLTVGLCIASLPWLVSRFLVLSALLGAISLYFIATTESAMPGYRRSSIIALCLPVVFSAVLLMTFNFHFYGSITPLIGHAGSGESLAESMRVPSLSKLASGLIGWLLDQNAGLFIYAPVYIVSLPGLYLLLKERRREAIPLFLPVAGAYLALAWQGFWPQWSIPVRYLVSVLPVLAIFVVHAIQRIDSVLFTAISLMLLLLSMATGGLLMVDPELPQAYRLHGRSGLLAKYGNLLSMDIERYVPSFRPEIAVLYATGPGLGEIGKAELDARVVQSQTGQPSLGRWVTKAETESQEVGYIFDRKWPEQEYAQFLAAGEYSACFRMRAEDGIAGDTVVTIFDVSTQESTLAQREVPRNEFAGKGYSIFCTGFGYPGGKRLRFRILFTDQADVWLDWVKLTHLDGSWGKWILSTIWLAGLLSFAAYFAIRYRSRYQEPGTEPSSRQLEVAKAKGTVAFRALTALLVLLIFAALGGYLYSLFSPKLFEAERLWHLTGGVVIDEEASGGKAVWARIGEKEGPLVYGPYQFFPPGEYKAHFRVKTSEGGFGKIEVATIDVFGNASGVLALQTIMNDDFKDADQYQEFRLLFSNPVPQALQFRVFFTRAADLWVDKITLQRILPEEGKKHDSDARVL